MWLLYLIFERTIAEEVKSSEAYLLYGLNAHVKLITIEKLEIKYK